MSQKKYTKSQMKHIRKEKARIRSEFFDIKKQEEEIKKVFDKMSGKLHVHPPTKTSTKPAKGKSEQKTNKKSPVAKEDATISEKVSAPKGVKSKKEVKEQKDDNK